MARMPPLVFIQNAPGQELQRLSRLSLMHGRELVGSHQWISERERWNELLFSIMASISPLPEEKLRMLVREMAALELLTPAALAVIATNGIEGEEAQGILGFLRDAGLPTLRRGGQRTNQAAYRILRP
jgi:hypothetical protein